MLSSIIPTSKISTSITLTNASKHRFSPKLSLITVAHRMNFLIKLLQIKISRTLQRDLPRKLDAVNQAKVETSRAIEALSAIEKMWLKHRPRLSSNLSISQCWAANCWANNRIILCTTALILSQLLASHSTLTLRSATRSMGLTLVLEVLATLRLLQLTLLNNSIGEDDHQLPQQMIMAEIVPPAGWYFKVENTKSKVTAHSQAVELNESSGK